MSWLAYNFYHCRFPRSRMGAEIAATADQVSRKFDALDSIEDTIAKLRQRLKDGMADETKIAPPFESAIDRVKESEAAVDADLLVTTCGVCGEEFPNTYIKAHRKLCIEQRKVPPDRIHRGVATPLPDAAADPSLLDKRLTSPMALGGRSMADTLREQGMGSEGLPDESKQRQVAVPRPRGTAVTFSLGGDSTSASARAGAPAAPGEASGDAVVAKGTGDGAGTEAAGGEGGEGGAGTGDVEAEIFLSEGGVEESKGVEGTPRERSRRRRRTSGVPSDLDFFLQPPHSRNTKSRRHYHRTENRPDTGWTRRSSVATAESDGSAFSIEGIAEFLQLDWGQDDGPGARSKVKDRVVEGLNTLFTEHFNPRSLGTGHGDHGHDVRASVWPGCS